MTTRVTLLWISLKKSSIKCKLSRYLVLQSRLMLLRYEQYVERKAETDSKYRAKKARKEHEDDEWEGFGDLEKSSDDDDDENDDEVIAQEDGNSNSDESEGENCSADKKGLLTSLDNNEKGTNGLSKRASLFFDQDIFKDIGDLDDGTPNDEENSDEDLEDVSNIKTASSKQNQTSANKVEQAKVNGTEESIRDGNEADAGWSDEDDLEPEINGSSAVGNGNDNGIEIVRTLNVDEWDANEPMKKGRLGKIFYLKD